MAATLAVAFTLGVLAGFGLPRVLGSASHATAAAAPGILGARSALTPDVARDGLAAIRADEKTPLTSIQLAPLVEGALSDVRAAERTMASAGAARHGPIAHTPDVAENNMSDAAYAARFGSR